MLVTERNPLERDFFVYTLSLSIIVMNIQIIRCVDDAVQAQWITVVIDVFRAFTTEAYIFANGAHTIIPVQSLDEAYNLKKENSEYILIWERGGIKPEGFDYGNSPTEILNVDFTGKTIIHTTSNGTKGLLLSKNALDILTGSFVNVGAIIKYIKEKNPTSISLISTSPNTSEENNEDLMLAYYIRDMLLGKEISQKEIHEMMKKTSAYSLLFNEVWVPASDFELCLDFDRFPFIIQQTEESGKKVLKKITV